MKYLVYTAFVVFSIALFQWVRQFLFCPQYQFGLPKKFEGDRWYNPYDSVRAQNWIKCNFHAHTNAWKGITNGKGDIQDIKRCYDRLGYDMACVSEYQKINYDPLTGGTTVPVYEHGYNILKTHQQVIGSSRVEWLDFIFPQNLSNKQRVLDKLSINNKSVIVLNHPNVRRGYSTKCVQRLSNYHCIEVLSPSSMATQVWDAALSTGHPVFITGNDDVHNVFDSKQAGRFCTWLNVADLGENNVLNALKTGKGYGMKIAQYTAEPEALRIFRIRNKLPFLKKISVNHDTVWVKVSERAHEIKFIGSYGVLKQSVCNVSGAVYPLKPDDSYIRIEVNFKDDTEMFLNPIFRYKVQPFEMQSLPTVLKTKSFLFKIIGVLILSSWTWVLFRMIWVPGLRIRFRSADQDIEWRGAVGS